MGALLGAVILVTMLAGCTLPYLNGTDPVQNAFTEEDLPNAEVDIQFMLTLPAPLVQGERVLLEILDEVTGLPYNARQYDLTLISETIYAVTLSIPQSTFLKYRYIKVGTSMVPEATALGEEVRYRLLSAEDVMTVADILQNWLDAPVTIATGSIAGQILSSETGLPLADILVGAAGDLTFTDANGHFSIDHISPGVHNVVFYALNGAFDTFQQGASIVSGRTTPINLSLNPRPTVQLTFRVTPPNDALGIPIYMAGNILQLGNTFADLGGGISVDAKQIRLLTPQEDGSQTLTLSLYAGLDLHYKFTLGDGYWNAEQISGNGGWRTRQLIVPDEDITLDLSISGWRVSDASPVTYEISIPPETGLGDEISIQFKTRDWTSPLPLWPLRDGRYLYILFSPLDTNLPVAYRFCRNADCDQALNAEALNSEMSVLPKEEPQTIALTLSDWVNWLPQSEPTHVVAASIPKKDPGYLTEIALSSHMDSSWQVFTPIGVKTIAEMGANSIQLTPQWFGGEDGLIRPEMGWTPFTADLENLISVSQTQALSVSLFPQIGPTDELAAYWANTERDSAWWESWFSSYETFILNYARIAADTGIDQLVLGGKATLPAFSGGFNLDGTLSKVPSELDQRWAALIEDIRSIYSGQLVWATSAQVSADPLPTFIDRFDAILVNVDAPLATLDLPNAELIASSFWEVLNTQIYPIYEQTGKPILLGLGYPSVTDGVLGCLMIDEACSNDGVFSPSETASSSIDLDFQVTLYNTLLPIIADQDWVVGVSMRGYNPVVTILDGSSSIAGKPARDVIWYWFAGFHTTE